MSVILNLETKNETLNNIISNNPYYIDIKGSVNICLVRCGQEIEACESVNFSTMTNYGKILVLNKSTKSNSKCAIKLAFDSSNDSLGNNGEANYNFETAFVSIPSLHKLNGTIYDMETFLVFSSIQKNGNVLYVCLCTFNMGVNSVAQGDWKLLNYKLMDELFVQKNIVPDIYGTNEITGVPNPVDLNNFIPKKGSRNFYDYTHPKNTKVNFRVFQTPLSVSNNVINTLKSKLTPGNTYVNFKNAISQTINPLEGLFFYFSEDLTDRYKSFAANSPPPLKNHQKEILEEEEHNEKSLKKLDVVHDEEENHSFNEKDKKEKHEKNDKHEKHKKENFQANSNESKASTTYAVYLIITVFSIIGIYTYIIKNFFKATNGISEEDLINFTNEIFNPNMTKVLASKFKINIFFSIIFILTFIIVFLLVISIPLNNQNFNTNTIFTTAFSFIIALIIIIPILFYYSLRYLFYRIKGFYDNDFSQKENYFYSFILNKIYNDNFLSNLSSIFKENFTNFLINIPQQNIQSGGGDETEKFNHAPGNINDNRMNAQIAQNKLALDGIGEFSLVHFFQLMNNKFVKSVFDENNQYKNSLKNIIICIVIFYIFGSILQLVFSSIGDNMGLKFVVSFLTSLVLYLPICFMLIEYVNSIPNKNLRYSVIILSLFIILGSLFTIFLNPINNIPINNIGYWITFSLIIISIITIFISKKFMKTDENGGSSNVANDDDDDLYNKIKILKTKLDEETTKRKFFEDYLEEFDDSKLPSAPDNEILDEIKKLKSKLDDKDTKIKELEEYIKGSGEIDGYESSNDNSMIGSPMHNVTNFQNQLLKMQENLNSKNKQYNNLMEQLENSKKEIELLKKIIPKENLIKTLQYLKLISNIFNKLQELKTTQNSLNKKNKILDLLDQLSKIDQSNNIPTNLDKELENLNKENPVNYKIIIDNLDKIINKIKSLAKSILDNINDKSES